METEAVARINTLGQDSGIAQFLAEYTWLAIVAFVLLLFKSTVENAVTGVMLFAGREYSEDDIVTIDGRPARIVRIGLTKTVFYMYSFRDGIIVGGTKMAVENSSLPQMRIERPLVKIDPTDLFRPGETNGHGKHDEEKEEQDDSPKDDE